MILHRLSIALLIILQVPLYASEQHVAWREKPKEDANSELFNYLQNVTLSRGSLDEQTIKDYIKAGAEFGQISDGRPILRMLISRPITEKDEEKFIAIMNCAMTEGKADPNLLISDGTRPLQWVGGAQARYRLHTKIVDILFKASANPQLKNTQGKNVLFEQEKVVNPVNPYDIIARKCCIKERIIYNYIRHEVPRLSDNIKKSQQRIKTFLHVLLCLSKQEKCYALSNDLKKYIISFIPEDISNPTMMKEVLNKGAQDQLLTIIAVCPTAWTKQVITNLKTQRSPKGEIIENYLRQHYIKKGKQLLLEKDNEGKMAMDSDLDLQEVLDPEHFEQNFKDLITEIMKTK